MGRRLDALNAIAVEQGYTGNEPTSVVGAINAIVDAMGGESNAVGVADAITALAPYIGGGSGGGIGAGFRLGVQDKNLSYVPPEFADTLVDNRTVSHAPKQANATDRIVLPTGASYVIGFDNKNDPVEIESVTFYDNSGHSETLEYTTEPIANVLLNLKFSVPFVSIEDGYTDSGDHEYGVMVRLA